MKRKRKTDIERQGEKSLGGKNSAVTASPAPTHRDE